MGAHLGGAGGNVTLVEDVLKKAKLGDGLGLT